MASRAARAFFGGGSDGYFTLHGVLAPAQVDGLARRVDSYISAHASAWRRSLLRPYGLGDQGGWYVADFSADDALRPILTALHGSRRLHAALTDVFGGPHDERYRILSRKDIYTDRHSEWHLDKLHGPFAWYMGGDRCAFWKALPDGGGAYRIVTARLSHNTVHSHTVRFPSVRC